MPVLQILSRLSKLLRGHAGRSEQSATFMHSDLEPSSFFVLARTCQHLHHIPALQRVSRTAEEVLIPYLYHDRSAILRRSTGNHVTPNMAQQGFTGTALL